MGKFQGLKVWERAKGAFFRDYGLRDQFRRASVSIPSNIAEGDELDSDRQAMKFFYMAKGSSAEVLTQAIISCEIGYITKEHFAYIQEECRAISGMLMKLIQARSTIHGQPKP